MNYGTSLRKTNPEGPYKNRLLPSAKMWLVLKTGREGENKINLQSGGVSPEESKMEVHKRKVTRGGKRPRIPEES